MNASEAATLLSLCSAYDRRTIGEADAFAWADALDDIRFNDAKDAVKAHYRESREWLMPCDVRAGVKKIREARIIAAESAGQLPMPPDGLTGAEWGEWKRKALEAVANGDEVPNGRQIGESRPRDVSYAQVWPRVSRVEP